MQVVCQMLDERRIGSGAKPVGMQQMNLCSRAAPIQIVDISVRRIQVILSRPNVIKRIHNSLRI